MLDQLNQNYFSPYMIFINGGYWMSDAEIMEKFGLEGYELITYEKGREIKRKAIFITEDDEWTHVMDDLSYHLWHNKELRKRLQALSKDFDIFICSVGDCDDSFDFTYYRNGEIIREYVVEDPHFKGGEVVKDLGEPFPIETEALKEKDIYVKVTTIAKSLGINLHHTKEKVRVYEKVEKKERKWKIFRRFS